MSAGSVFTKLVRGAKTSPVPILGTVNAYSALLAKEAGAQSIYLSGSGVATASFGLPDLGITNLNDVIEDVNRITNAVDLPLLVDVDTGFGDMFGIQRMVRAMEKAGAAAIHIEDQVAMKRCGHRPGKQVVPCEEMCDRLISAVDGRKDGEIVIMARTDALATESMDQVMKRCLKYIESGADMLFIEAVTDKEQYKTFKEAFPNVPILANITEFGQTPLWSQSQLHEVGVDMVLYPLSAHRAMAKAASNVYKSILENGHQGLVIDQMQTRDELYQVLGYHEYEQQLDKMLANKD